VYVVVMALALALECGMSLWWWRSWVAAERPPRSAKLRLLSFGGAVLLLIAFTRFADPFAHPSDVIVLLFAGFGYSVVIDELVTPPGDPRQGIGSRPMVSAAAQTSRRQSRALVF
jgi:hypothetical protein